MYTNTDPLSPRLFHSWSPVVHSYIAARQSSFSAYIHAETAQLDNPRSMQQDSQRGISLYLENMQPQPYLRIAILLSC